MIKVRKVPGENPDTASAGKATSRKIPQTVATDIHWSRLAIDPRVENPEEIRDRIVEAVRYIPVKQLGTTDDRGFSPFRDDTLSMREKAFPKIRLRWREQNWRKKLSMVDRAEDEPERLRSTIGVNMKSAHVSDMRSIGPLRLFRVLELSIAAYISA
jgi:hypothetical protein